MRIRNPKSSSVRGKAEIVETLSTLYVASIIPLPSREFRFKEASRLVLNVASLGAAAPHRISFLFQPPTAP